MTHPSIKFNQSQRKSIHTHHSYRFPFSGLGVPDSGRPKRSGTREDGLDVPVITEVWVVIENELQQSNIEDLLEISHCFKLWLKLFPKVKFWRLNAKVKVLQTLVKSVNRPNTLTLTLMTDFPIEHLKWWRFAPVVRGRCSCSVPKLYINHQLLQKKMVIIGHLLFLPVLVQKVSSPDRGATALTPKIIKNDHDGETVTREICESREICEWCSMILR